jgi:hypothetical protein
MNQEQNKMELINEIINVSFEILQNIQIITLR